MEAIYLQTILTLTDKFLTHLGLSNYHTDKNLLRQTQVKKIKLYSLLYSQTLHKYFEYLSDISEIRGIT